MLTAASLALHQLFTPSFRAILFKCLAYTMGLLAVLIIGMRDLRSSHCAMVLRRWSFCL